MSGAVLVIRLALSRGGYQGPPPPPPVPPVGLDREHVGRRLADLHRRLSESPLVNQKAKRAAEESLRLLDRAQQSLARGELFRTDRIAAASESFRHVAEHQQHLKDGGGPKGAPSPEEVRRRLEHSYFQVQSAKFLLGQTRDPEARTYPQWAQDFYQQALRSGDAGLWIVADENAKCAEEIVKALEALAQADHGGLPPAPPLPPPAPKVRP